MGYCERQDLVDRIGEPLLVELTDLERTGESNDERLARAIEDASARVDSYAAQRYPTPFSPVPPQVRAICIDLVLYALFARRGFNETSADEVIVSAQKDAVRWLEQLSAGRVHLGQATPAKDTGATVVAPGRIFGRDRMEGF